MDDLLNLSYLIDREKVDELKQIPADSLQEWTNDTGYTALHLAARWGRSLSVEEIYKVCPRLLTCQDRMQQTPLHMAAARGYVGIVKFLIYTGVVAKMEIQEEKDREKADKELLRMVDKDKNTALHLAVNHQYREIVKLLSEADPDYEYLPNTCGSTPLGLALGGNSIRILKQVLRASKHSFHRSDKSLEKAFRDFAMSNDWLKSENIDWLQLMYKRYPSLLYIKFEDKRSALHIAVDKGKTELVEFLIYPMGKLRRGEDEGIGSRGGGEDEDIIDTKLSRMVDSSRQTALHIAVAQEKLDVVNLLVKDKKLLVMLNSKSETALHLAVRSNIFEIVKELVEADSNMKLLKKCDKKKNTALHWAMMGKSTTLQVVKCLTKADPELVTMVNAENNTALHLAVQKSLHDVVTVLASASNEARYSPNNEEMTPLYIAAEMGSHDMVKTILDACPSSAYDGPNGETALHAALARGSTDIRKLLLKTRPEQSREPNREGWTSLHTVSSKGDLSAVEDIIQHCPASSKVVDKLGQNYLHLAAKGGHVGVVEHALRSGSIDASVLNKQDNYGYTPLHTAVETGNAALIKCLLYDSRVDKRTKNTEGTQVLNAITVEYDKKKAGVHGVRDKVNEKKLENRSNFDLLVGALIATVSFTVGITVPGGYNSDGPNKGMAVLSEKLIFRIFVISNSCALFLSLSAVFSHFCTRRLLKKSHIHFHAHSASLCTLAAIFAMVTAFTTGSFSVLPGSDELLTISIGLLCACFLLFASSAICMMAMAYLHKYFRKSMEDVSNSSRTQQQNIKPPALTAITTE